ncbi:MAG: hypothetical protein AVDCRST_MAG59-4068, partial [uncultured Thermomicrobiales bacterium]
GRLRPHRPRAVRARLRRLRKGNPPPGPSRQPGGDEGRRERAPHRGRPGAVRGGDARREGGPEPPAICAVPAGSSAV